jgi:hypothetical protein
VIVGNRDSRAKVILMATAQAVKTTSGPGSNEAAKWIASELYRFVGPDRTEPETVVEMYEWVRASELHREEWVRMSEVARLWAEFRRGEHESNWMMRAFGES